MSERTIVVGGTLINATFAAALMLLAGSDIEATELALRATARASFVWFILGFLASPLQQLWPSRLSGWLVRRRRALGIVFGLSMSIHVGFILRLYVLHAPQRPPMVTDADFFIGIPGLVMVASMTVTSVRALQRRMSPRAWQLVHTTGVWFVWAIFLLCLVDSVGRKQTAHPVLAYHSFIAGLVVAAALRVVARRSRRSVVAQPSTGR
jgi:sulfoxide reductase heme-binding subunit YedZ